MSLTERQLALAVLERQFLPECRSLDVAEAVRRLCALRAQEPASPYLALGNRVQDFATEDLDAAFADGRVVKSTLMRLTLHVVHAEDHEPYRAAVLSTLRRRHGCTTAGSPQRGRPPPTPMRCCRSSPGSCSSRARAPGWSRRSHGGTASTRTACGGRCARSRRCTMHRPAARGRSPGRTATVPPRRPLRSIRGRPTPGPAFAALVLACVRARAGPGLRPLHPADAHPAAEALRALGDRVVRVQGPGRAALFDPADATVPDDTPAPPGLLPMWDSTLPAHAVPGRLVPAEYRPLVVRRNGDVLPPVCSSTDRSSACGGPSTADWNRPPSAGSAGLRGRA